MTLFKKNGKPNTDKSGDSALLNLKRIVIGVIFGAVTFALLLFMFSLIMTFGSVPDDASVIFAFLAIALASFIAGFASLWKIGAGGLINGLICGGVLAAVHLLLSLIFGEGGSLVYIIISVAIELILATFGGIVSVNVRSK